MKSETWSSQPFRVVSSTSFSWATFHIISYKKLGILLDTSRFSPQEFQYSGSFYSDELEEPHSDLVPVTLVSIRYVLPSFKTAQPYSPRAPLEPQSLPCDALVPFTCFPNSETMTSPSVLWGLHALIISTTPMSCTSAVHLFSSIWHCNKTSPLLLRGLYVPIT